MSINWTNLSITIRHRKNIKKTTIRNVAKCNSLLIARLKTLKTLNRTIVTRMKKARVKRRTMKTSKKIETRGSTIGANGTSRVESSERCRNASF